jgi:hypothetical protein
MTTNFTNRTSVAYVIGPSVIVSSTDSLQQKVSLYTKWFYWILSEFTDLVNMDYWIAPIFCSNDFFFQKLDFLKFIWIFNNKNQCFSHCELKFYQINSIKSYSSRSFQHHQGHIPIPP